MKQSTGGLVEWLIPFALFVCGGWAIWHMPAYILDFLPPDSESLFAQMSELHKRKDVLPDLPGLFGGFADMLDWLALILIPVLTFFGMKTMRHASMEYPHWRNIDRFAIFIGRLVMILIISMTCIMLYEVLLRYVVEAPTLWANELTLWIAGFVFMLSGFYAMQQRSHIRIFLLYDIVPRPVQHVFDVVWVVLLAIFAFFLVYGSFYQVFVIKFYKWEMFGTAFDPPIPATIQPLILITITLVAFQAIANLIADWNLEPEVHSAADDIDEEELKAIKRSVGRTQ